MPSTGDSLHGDNLRSLSSDLRRLVAQTEAVYLKLGESLPEIFKELDQGVEDYDHLISPEERLHLAMARQ